MRRRTTNHSTTEDPAPPLIEHLAQAVRASPTVALVVACVRLGRKIVGGWLLLWGILMVTKEALRALAGLGGLSVLSGLSLLGARTPAPRA